MNVNLQQVWEMLGGETYLRNTIQKACQDNGVSVSAAEVERITNEVSSQVPQIIAEAEQQAAQQMARVAARREYQRFCRACGIRPDSQFL